MSQTFGTITKLTTFLAMLTNFFRILYQRVKLLTKLQISLIKIVTILFKVV